MGASEKMVSDAIGLPPEQKCPVCGFKADHDPSVHFPAKPKETK